MKKSRGFTITAGAADVVEEIHDEVQVHQLVIKALVVQFEQLLLSIAALRGDGLVHRQPTRAAHLSGNPGRESEALRLQRQSSALVVIVVFVSAHRKDRSSSSDSF